MPWKYGVFSKHVFHVPNVPVNTHPIFKGFHALDAKVAIEEKVFNRFSLYSTNGAYIIIHHSHTFVPVFCFESFMVSEPDHEAASENDSSVPYCICPTLLYL